MIMFLPRWAPSKFLIPGLFVAVVLASIQLTQAKSIRSLGYSNSRNSDAIKMRRGGCAAFGHSCFGGHGKRSESTTNPMEGDEAPAGLQTATDTLIYSEGPRAPAEIYGRDQPENDYNLIIPSQYQPEDYLRLSALFRKWLANSYRRDLVPVNN